MLFSKKVIYQIQIILHFTEENSYLQLTGVIFIRHVRFNFKLTLNISALSTTKYL